jgi:uncharacterized protein (DUF169 family)
MSTAERLQDLLGLQSPPIAITFRTEAPAGVPRVPSAGPSSCTYWALAAQGRAFYTEASDHYNCPIGGYTHGVDLPPTQMQELQNVVGTMIGLGYLRSEEVPNIPRRKERFGVAVYAPLKEAAEPDVVLMRGNPRQMMLLEEAAQAAGLGSQSALMGRPTCAALPAALQSGRGVASLGCIGNRVYTHLPDNELYYALPGKHVAAVVERLAAIVHANRELEKYHLARRG